MSNDVRFSRPISAAARLREYATDHNRFVEKRVLLTGEADTLATANGRECFLSSLRLLLRVCPNLSVALPIGAPKLTDACHEVTERIAFGPAVEFVSKLPNYAAYDAVLSVGTAARPDLPWTVINSNGWLARVSSMTAKLPMTCDQPNPIGALTAACIGVAEVFKRLIRLKESRGRLSDGLAFSLHSYSCSVDDPGPDLPPELPLDLLLVGAGAIGNGIVHLLCQLPTCGRIFIIDGQAYHDENLGTCLLIGPEDVGTAKAEFAATVLRGRLQATSFNEELAVFERRLGSDVPHPRLILTALDNIDARHGAQNQWPDLIIDGAIGDFACQVSRHQWGDENACLKCLFRHPPGPPAEVIASAATGLTRARTQQPEEVVTEEDIRIAPTARSEWLRTRVGKRICSVVQEGVAQQISNDQQKKGFAPSVPFVACMSAAMVVAELVKFVGGWQTSLETRFQFDSLRGPALGMMVPQSRGSDCQCVARAANIERWRRQRSLVRS